MKNQKLIFSLASIFFLFVFTNSIAQTQNFDNVNITIGTKYGVKFWGGNDATSITMGGLSKYHYGPVTNYSIKTSMTPTAGNGWVWGSNKVTPVAALSILGEFQTEGFIKSMDGNFYFGDNQRISGDGNSNYAFYSNNSKSSILSLLDKENTHYGSIVGTSDGAEFGLMDGNGDWSYRITKGSHTSFLVNNEEKMRINLDGNVGIGTGTMNLENKLEVCGTIRAEECIIQENWCDFVFDSDYVLPTLEEEKMHIEEAGYLMGFESEEMMAGEIDLGDVTKRQQQKIEELVLHQIELNETINSLQEQLSELKAKLH